jgi:hypothetical protein
MSTITVTNIKATGETASRSATGVAAAWLNSTQVGTQAIRDSLNFSSLTDLGVGQTQPHFTSSMANDDYAGSVYFMASAGENYSNFDNHYAGGFGNKDAGSFKTYSFSTTAVDSGIHDIIIMGELA